MKAAPEFKIDKRVKLVGTIRRRKSSQYPFEKMEVGHSFAIPDDYSAKKVRSAVWAFKQVHPEYDFTVRRMEDGTYRCWRIEVGVA